jgi:hypothetical protein
MISNMGDPKQWDPTSTCMVQVDNQVTGKRATVVIMLSRGETIDGLMASFSCIDPETGALEWLDEDPLSQEPIATCAHVHLQNGPIIIRHYATGSIERARRAMAELLGIVDLE